MFSGWEVPDDEACRTAKIEKKYRTDGKPNQINSQTNKQIKSLKDQEEHFNGNQTHFNSPRD